MIFLELIVITNASIPLTWLLRFLYQLFAFLSFAFISAGRSLKLLFVELSRQCMQKSLCANMNILTILKQHDQQKTMSLLYKIVLFEKFDKEALLPLLLCKNLRLWSWPLYKDKPCLTD